MGTFSEGDLVYAPCSGDTAFLRATVVNIPRRSEEIEVEVEYPDDSTDKWHLLPSELRGRFVRSDGDTSADNTSLVYLNDAAILDNLRQRHSQDEIYTYTASVLLAVNPYKDIVGMYGEDQCARYRGKHIGMLPPHPYAIADCAYRALGRECKNQGLLISGESGAGKTETAKIVMQYLAYASGASCDHANNIQARVLRAQPIMESFGNAVTTRNSNSSRFGKYNRVFFDDTGTLVDAGITTYLLESSRVVNHGANERNYHCFYELLCGLDKDGLEDLKLDAGRHYRLLCCNAGSDALVETLDCYKARDVSNFHRLVQSFETVGLTSSDIDALFRVVAGIVHLGELEASAVGSGRIDTSDDDADDVVRVDEVSLQNAAALLGIDADEFRTVLTKKKIAVPGRCSFHEVPRSHSQFRYALASFIKSLYKRLFEWIVRRINDSFEELRRSTRSFNAETSSAQESCRHIGILDIYGFESMQTNSFEQLCINLANERLQQYFVENVLRVEQEVYSREGLPWTSLSLPDAQPVVAAIGSTFKTLDEYSQNLSLGVGNATDRGFCQKVVEEASKCSQRKEVLKQIKMGGGRRSVRNNASAQSLSVHDGFIINHYAGAVQYSTVGWMDKNNDRLLPECEALICDSCQPLVKSWGDEDNVRVGFRSISKKYQIDLEALLETLSTSNLHYIRCFRPNGAQQANKFEGKFVLDQLVQCGTIELVKIMHDGFPNRCSFEEIATRFESLLPEQFLRYGRRTFIEALMTAYDVPSHEWALGMSRLFLKAGQLKALESMRTEGATPPAERLSSIVRGIILNRWKRAGCVVMVCNFIPKFIAQLSIKRAETALAGVSILAHSLSPVLAAARERILQRRLIARRRLVGVIHAVTLSHFSWTTIRSKRRTRLASCFHLVWYLHSHMRLWIMRARQRVEEKRVEEKRLRLASWLYHAWFLHSRTRPWVSIARGRVKQRRLAAINAAKQQDLEPEKQSSNMAGKMHVPVGTTDTADDFITTSTHCSLTKKQEVEQNSLVENSMCLSNPPGGTKQPEEDLITAAANSKVSEKHKAEESTSCLSSILSIASPQRKHATIPSVKVDRTPPVCDTSIAATKASNGGVSDEDSCVGDLSASFSTLAMCTELTATQRQIEMEDRVRQLEHETAQKYREIQEQMALLKEKNRDLESQLEEERQERRNFLLPAESSPQPSLIPLDEALSRDRSGRRSASATASTGRQRTEGFQVSPPNRRSSMPGGGPDTSGKPRASGFPSPLVLDFDQCSPLSLGGEPRPGSTTRRRSVASEALWRRGSESDSRREEASLQRKWWAEQRQFLMNDLYSTAEITPSFLDGSDSMKRKSGIGVGGKNLNDVFENAVEQSQSQSQAPQQADRTSMSVPSADDRSMLDQSFETSATMHVNRTSISASSTVNRSLLAQSTDMDLSEVADGVLATKIHPSAAVAPSRIRPPSRIKPPTRFGSNKR